MALILDTHALIWTAEGEHRRIGLGSRRLIVREQSGGALWISSMTLFEIAALQTAGRLYLTPSIEQWIRDAMEAGTLRVAEVSPGIAIDAGQIPRRSLPDPIDRLLAATARQLDATLLTNDARLLDYAAATHSLKVHAAAR